MKEDFVLIDGIEFVSAKEAFRLAAESNRKGKFGKKNSVKDFNMKKSKFAVNGRLENKNNLEEIVASKTAQKKQVKKKNKEKLIEEDDEDLIR